MHALCNAVKHCPSGLPIKSAVSFIIAEMFNSTLKERCRWLLRLGSSAPCCLQSMLTMTAPFYMIRSATNSPNNLWDKALTFLPFSARCLALLQQLLSPQSQGTWDGCCCQIRLAQKFLRDHWSSSERSLEGDSPLHRPLPAKYPHKSMNIVHVGVCVKTFRYAIHILIFKL